MIGTGLKSLLQKREARTRLMGVVFALGAFATLPTPSPQADTVSNVVLISLWAVLGLLAWVVWYKPAFLLPNWIAAMLLAFVAWKTRGIVFPLIVLSCWGLWFRLRVAREAALRPQILLWALLGLGFLRAEAKTTKKPSAPVAPAKATAQATPKPSPTADFLGEEFDSSPRPAAAKPPAPKYLTGYELRDLSSCSAVDRVPWKFRADRRKTRLLLRDELRLHTEAEFATWEVHQVMDGDGYVTYLFAKLRDGKRSEVLAVKDNVYNRIVEKNGVTKVVEVQDLRTLINRPVISFMQADGSTAAFSPGLAGQSVFAIELKSPLGRALPPMYIRGSFCERAQGDTNSVDLLGKGTAAEAPAK